MPRGGKQPGAGRPRKYGDSTKVIRIPQKVEPVIRNFLEKLAESTNANVTEFVTHPTYHDPLPIYSSRVQAGMPSPADDYIEDRIDLHDHMIEKPRDTFGVRVIGDSMKDDGMLEGDLILVDRSIEPRHGMIIVAALNGDVTVKRLFRRNGEVRLIPENNAYKPIPVNEDDEFVIWGAVTGLIRRYQ